MSVMVNGVSVSVSLLCTPDGELVVEVVVAASELSGAAEVVSSEAVSLEEEESGLSLGKVFKMKIEMSLLVIIVGVLGSKLARTRL